MEKIRICSLLLILLSLSHAALAQDFMLQGWYWNYPGTADGHVWAYTLNAKAQELANAGFTYVWLPPLSRASFGSTSNGYDPKDLFDLGEFGGGNPATTITYQMPQAGRVTLRVFNMLGQLVRTLIDAEVDAGMHATAWNAKNDRGEFVSSGVYIYQFKAGEVVRTKKMLLAK